MQQRTYFIIMAYIFAFITTAFIICTLISHAQAQIDTTNKKTNSNSTIQIETYQTYSKPFGLTYGEWTAKWWQWAYSIPKDVNPAYDDTGKYCSKGQSGPVWFLTGAYSHSVDRYCTIPAGKSILFTILNSECSFAEFPKLKTQQDLRRCSKEMQDAVVHFEASVDGININDLRQYRIQSPLFNFTLPKNNILGLPSQTAQAVADGNWVFLKSLPVGEHIIHFKGGLKKINASGAATAKTNTNVSNYNFAGPYGWDYPVTYHLTIVRYNKVTRSGPYPSSYNQTVPQK
jgi:hypothetical protein